MTGTSRPSWKTGETSKSSDDPARTTFARIYPVIADQILERTGITTGACIDLGSGSALLAIALALLSNLRVTALDRSPDMYDLAWRNIRDRCMEELVVPVTGDVHAIPAADATFSLAVSRGSYHAWEDLPVAFREISRVLRPGGMACIGGGYGSARLRDEVLAMRRERGIADDLPHPSGIRFRRVSAGEICAALESAGIRDYEIIDDDSGFWIVFRKGEATGSPADPAPAPGDTRTAGRSGPEFRYGFFF